MSWFELLIVEAAVITLGSPVAGVAAFTRWRTGIAAPAEAPSRRLAVRSAVAAALVACASFAAWRVGAATAVIGTGALARAHVFVAVAIWMLVSGGTVAAALFRNPLDAAAVASATSATLAFGVIAAGPLVMQLPARALDALLFASPFVVGASAADVDLFRTSMLYAMSPIAHVRFDYPAWPAAALVYGAVGMLCSALAGRRGRSMLRSISEGVYP